MEKVLAASKMFCFCLSVTFLENVLALFMVKAQRWEYTKLSSKATWNIKLVKHLVF
jgi:hypothetical protein